MWLVERGGSLEIKLQESSGVGAPDTLHITVASLPAIWLTTAGMTSTLGYSEIMTEFTCLWGWFVYIFLTTICANGNCINCVSLPHEGSVSLERAFALPPSCRHCSPSLSLSSNQTLIQMFLHSHCKGFPESNLKQTQTDFRNRNMLSLYGIQTEHCTYTFVLYGFFLYKKIKSYKVDKFELRSALQDSVDKLLSLRFLQIE